MAEAVLQVELQYIANPTAEAQQTWMQKQANADISRKKAEQKRFFFSNLILKMGKTRAIF